MECSAAMSRLVARFVMILFVTLISPSGVANEVRSLVLVTHVGANNINLTNIEIRRLFLGLPVAQQQRRLIAVINRTESLLYQVFLQKVLFMSAPLYERQLLANVVRQSGIQPPVYTDQQALLRVLRTQPSTVTFMWQDQISAGSGVVVIAVIWQGSVH